MRLEGCQTPAVRQMLPDSLLDLSADRDNCNAEGSPRVEISH